jgi:hypothetical protein
MIIMMMNWNMTMMMHGSTLNTHIIDSYGLYQEIIY